MRDGCCYDRDLVVGADDVHSRVRSEMWKMADALRPGLITSRERGGRFYILYLWLAMINATLGAPAMNSVPDLIVGARKLRVSKTKNPSSRFMVGGRSLLVCS